MKRRALVIAGTHSGSGKTTLTLGIMAALKKLGHKLVPFKCGPDFIDPSLHRLVTGEESRNLDIWMAGEESVHNCYHTHSEPGTFSVIEGVMGMFDGAQSSSAALAKNLGVPLILVLDVRSSAESGAAVLKGFEVLDPEVRPAGVILNMVGSPKHLQMVSDAIQEHCKAKILGHLPRNLEFSIPSRHLGLHMGEESPITPEQIEKLADTVISHIDMDALVELSEIEEKQSAEVIKSGHVELREPAIRIGVARDQAFCFYYEDNFDLWRHAGAEICYFSPLHDTALPENISALYLGGGYPELYGKKLSANKQMLEAIREKVESQLPVYCECGGFMYLTEGITDLEGDFHSLAGVFPTKAEMQTKRASLGYRELTTRSDSFFGPKGSILRGHEFHYSKITPMDDQIERVYAVNNGTVEGYRYKNTMGGYMHLHFGYSPQAVQHFIDFCKG